MLKYADFWLFFISLMLRKPEHLSMRNESRFCVIDQSRALDWFTSITSVQSFLLCGNPISLLAATRAEGLSQGVKQRKSP